MVHTSNKGFLQVLDDLVDTMSKLHVSLGTKYHGARERFTNLYLELFQDTVQGKASEFPNIMVNYKLLIFIIDECLIAFSSMARPVTLLYYSKGKCLYHNTTVDTL